MANLLFECFSEEIPARMQGAAAKQLEKLMKDLLEFGAGQAPLHYSKISTYVSARHLAIHVEGLPEKLDDVTLERKGPSTNAPIKAVDGFASSVGLKAEQLNIRSTDKGTYYFSVVMQKAKPITGIIEEIILDILHRFHWPKSMRWGSYDLKWVRPLHSLVCLLDDVVIPVQFHQLIADRVTYGHPLYGT